MMLLAIDIGNSALKAAVFEATELVDATRLDYGDVELESLAARLQAATAAYSIRRVAISSVVPHVEKRIAHAFRDLPTTRISIHSRLPIRIAYDDPGRLGADRIALIVGASDVARGKYGARGPVVAIDAGTAVTLNVLDASSTFVGGLIWAGPDLVQKALHDGTAQLPPPVTKGSINVISGDPVTAIRSAATIGFVEGVRGMLRRITERLGVRPFVVATGGRASLLHAELGEAIEAVEPHLVLHGVRLIAERADSD